MGSLFVEDLKRLVARDAGRWTLLLFPECEILSSESLERLRSLRCLNSEDFSGSFTSLISFRVIERDPIKIRISSLSSLSIDALAVGSLVKHDSQRVRYMRENSSVSSKNVDEAPNLKAAAVASTFSQLCKFMVILASGAYAEDRITLLNIFYSIVVVGEKEISDSDEFLSPSNMRRRFSVTNYLLVSKAPTSVEGK